MKQIYYKTALRSLISLSIPTILEEVLSTLLQYVDTAMVGHLGEKADSGGQHVGNPDTWYILVCKCVWAGIESGMAVYDRG